MKRIHAELIATSRTLDIASANLSRAEKAEAAAQAERSAQVEAERRIGMALLSEVAAAQRMISEFPPLIYSGPKFVVWAGHKVEKQRKRGLRNPHAKDIWGIPLDFI